MSRTTKRDTIVAIVVCIVLGATVFALSGCAGTVNELYVQQNRSFNSVVVPELLDGYNSNPAKTELQKANINAAVSEHVAAVEKWSAK